MPHIQQLDTHVADLIAAGEVVERPASVAKELLENAIDAGADNVTVEIQHGGMSLIRVTDNGCGIAPEEAETAFLRHATSKIRGERDLEAIGTLGFRGEALAAIAAVSRVEIMTRREADVLGVSVSLEGGTVTGREEAGCPTGTTLLVRDLFYNTPARLKFVKKDAAEGAAVFAAVQRLALSHPEVSVKFLRDGKQELLTPGDGQLQSAVYAVLGRDLALGFTRIKGSGEEMSVAGFASLPACCRASRGYQHFFVNGRYVKSRTMMAALEEAYQNQKMVGKFPGCVLHLTTKLSVVDVNVHPTKTEVKFVSERQAFDAVYYAVKSALEADGSHPAADLTPAASRQERVKVSGGQTQHMTAEQYRALSGTGAAKTPYPDQKRDTPMPTALHDYTRSTRTIPRRELPTSPVEPAVMRGLAEKKLPVRADRRAFSAPEPDESPAACSEPVPPPPQVSPMQLQPEEQLPMAPAGEPAPWRMAGEVLGTYIVVEQGERVLLIDKHAAHERMNFDALKAAGYQPMIQTLLTPVIFTPPAEEGAALLQQLTLLSRFGFSAEDFGGGSLIVREVPDYVDPGDVEAVLLALAGTLLTTGRASPEAARDELMHTMACKAAIKGGQKNDANELHRVAEAVLSGRVKYCPHGRPVAIELTRGQIERQFKRI